MKTIKQQLTSNRYPIKNNSNVKKINKNTVNSMVGINKNKLNRTNSNVINTKEQDKSTFMG